MALKRDKQSTSQAPGSASAVPGSTTGAKSRGAPGSASAGSGSLSALGISGGPLQATRIQSEFRKQHALVCEYIDLKGLTAAYVEEKGPDRMLREAVNLKAVPLPPALFSEA